MFFDMGIRCQRRFRNLNVIRTSVEIHCAMFVQRNVKRSCDFHAIRETEFHQRIAVPDLRFAAALAFVGVLFAGVPFGLPKFRLGGGSAFVGVPCPVPDHEIGVVVVDFRVNSIRRRTVATFRPQPLRQVLAFPAR